MTGADRARVFETLASLRAAGGLGMGRVYERLFRDAPETQALFIGDMGAQMRRFPALLETVAREGLAPHAGRLAALGRRHAAAGVEHADHAALRAALLETLGETLGHALTTERAAAWGRLYDAVAAAMAPNAAVVGGERLELPTSSV